MNAKLVIAKCCGFGVFQKSILIFFYLVFDIYVL